MEKDSEYFPIGCELFSLYQLDAYICLDFVRCNRRNIYMCEDVGIMQK